MLAKRALITGISGQDGAYLSKFLLGKGYDIIGVGRSYNTHACYRLEYLGIWNQIEYIVCDLLDSHNVDKIIKKSRPDEIYNLAAQSSVGLSFSQPLATVQFNTVSVLNLLEAVRASDIASHFYHASSSEMFGRIEQLPAKEDTPFHPVSPYAVSKMSAQWIARNYREAYGMHVSCGIMFNHESYLRSTNFFVKKVIQESVKIHRDSQKGLKVGNIDLKRDFGYAPCYVEAMWLMLQQDKPDDYVVCSGNSVSLRDIIYHVFQRLSIGREQLMEDDTLMRPLDIYDIYGDNTKAKRNLGWNYEMDFFAVLDLLIEEELRNYH